MKAVRAVKQGCSVRVGESVVLRQGFVRFCPPGDENISGPGTSLVIPVPGHPRSTSGFKDCNKFAIVVVVIMASLEVALARRLALMLTVKDSFGV